MEPATLAYVRDALADGQWWRVATASLAHLSPTHAAMNAGALAAILAVWGRGRVAEALAALAALSVAHWSAAYWMAPALAWGAGASGALHGLVAYWGVRDALDARAAPAWRRFGAVALAGLGFKLAAEAAWPPGGPGFPVAVELHRIGAGLGLLLGAAASAVDARRRPRVRCDGGPCRPR